jgi:hypothetical protein
MKYYKFVKWEARPIEEVLKSDLPQALMQFDKGNKQPLKDLHIATQNPTFNLGGWSFPYREYLKRFWVKTKYYGILEYFALNKTDIRKELKSAVLEIVEV